MVNSENDHAAEHIERRHKRHQFFTHTCNGFYTAEYYERSENSNDNTNDPGIDTEIGITYFRNGVYLSCTADSKGSESANTAKIIPSHFMFSPRSSAYMAPPCIRPSAVFTRYFTAIRDSAYLVAIPNTPVSQHQSTAPGPPRAIAVPTPMILPVPIVDASAVARAPNWLTSPSAPSSFATERGIPL